MSPTQRPGYPGDATPARDMSFKASDCRQRATVASRPDAETAADGPCPSAAPFAPATPQLPLALRMAWGGLVRGLAEDDYWSTFRDRASD